MDQAQSKEKVKQMCQVLIDKKNVGEGPFNISRKCGLSGVRDFKNISYRFKEIFGIDIHFAPGLQLILPPDQLEMSQFVEHKCISAEEKVAEEFTTIDHITTMLMPVMLFRGGKITEPQLKKVMTEKLQIKWDQPDSLHGNKSAKQIIAQMVKDNMIKKKTVDRSRISTQTQINDDQSKVTTYEIGARATTIYNWDKVFEAGLHHIEQFTGEVLPENERKRAKIHCKSVIKGLKDAKEREHEKSDAYNVKPETGDNDRHFHY